MFSKIAILAAATASTFVAMPAAAQAQYHGYPDRYGYGYDRGYSQSYRTDRYGRTYTYDRYGNRVYVNTGGYAGTNGYYGNGGYYGRSTGGYYNNGYRRCSGTTGTIVGGVAGALLGSQVGRGGYYSRGGSNTTGAIVGGAIGALAGRAVDKNSCR